LQFRRNQNISPAISTAYSQHPLKPPPPWFTMWTTMETPVIRRPRILQTAGEKISISRAIAKHPRDPESPDPRYSQRTQFSKARKSPDLNNPKSLTNNDFHNSQNWFHLGSFLPNFAPFPSCPGSCVTAPPHPPRKCFFTKRAQQPLKNRAPLNLQTPAPVFYKTNPICTRNCQTNLRTRRPIPLPCTIEVSS
jgi:hypothetical protein